MFKKAIKSKSKLRLLLEGVSGSGKTYSSLMLANTLGKKIAVIDTEKGSASLYGKKFAFDECELLPPYTPEKYIEAIKFAEKSGYDVLIIDSVTHEWSGDGGVLDIHSKMTGNSYTNWAKLTPRHNKFIEAILQSNMHIIATARAKTDYVLEQKDGKAVPKKTGLKTEQREGLDFEFTTVFRLDDGGSFSCSKDRMGLFIDRFEKLSEKHANEILEWLNEGEEQPKEPSIYVLIDKSMTEQELLNLYEKNKFKVKDDKDVMAAFSTKKQEIIAAIKEVNEVFS
jgi:hypothetical protein